METDRHPRSYWSRQHLRDPFIFASRKQRLVAKLSCSPFLLYVRTKKPEDLVHCFPGLFSYATRHAGIEPYAVFPHFFVSCSFLRQAIGVNRVQPNLAGEHVTHFTDLISVEGLIQRRERIRE